MKTLTLSILLFCCSLIYGQTNDIEYLVATGYFINQTDSTTNDSLCIERGHINPGSWKETLMYCPPYIIDTDSTTVLVYPACNFRSYDCRRCGRAISELEPEQRIVTWRKQN